MGRATTGPRRLPHAARRLLQTILFVSALAALAACARPPSGSQHLLVATQEHAFIDTLLAGQPLGAGRVDGYLLLPAGPGPFAATVLLHGAGGFGSQDRHYAELLTDAGYAVLALDSFAARGVEKTVKDQTLVSEAAMLADAYGALALLAGHPAIRGEAIAVLGFSKGGTAALYAAQARIAEALAPGGPRFAAHAAFYPWCGLALQRPASTGRPILLQVGAADEITPAADCATLVEGWRAVEPALALELAVYPGAGHAFDHPLLGDLALPVRGAIPNRCRFVEQADGGFVEARSRRPVSAENLAETLAACSSPSAWIEGDSDAAAQAEARLLDFLARALGSPAAAAE